MGIFVFLGFILSFLMLPTTNCEKVVNKEPIPWKKLINDKDIAALFVFRFSYTTCIGIIWSFMPVFADTQFSISSSNIGILIMIGIFVSGIMHIPMGYLADYINKKIIIITGGVIATIAIILLERSGGFYGLILSNILFGIGGGISMPALMAISVLKGNHTASMSSIMSMLTMGHSLGMLAGAICAGLMMEIFDLRYAFLLGAVIMTIGTGFLGRSLELKKN